MSPDVRILTEKGWKTKRQFLRVYPNLDRSNKEADMPVPDRLFQRRKSKWLVSRLKLSQMIALLMWQNREGILSSGGKERLLYLQSKAPISAMEASLAFLSRLTKEEKLRFDFLPHMAELNRRAQSKRFRRYEVSRIGVGYRDKGTLRPGSDLARSRADNEGFVFLADLPFEVVLCIIRQFPTSMEGEWLDLENLSQLLKESDYASSDLPFLLRK